MYLHLSDPVCLLCGRRGRIDLAQYQHITGNVPAPPETQKDRPQPKPGAVLL